MTTTSVLRAFSRSSPVPPRRTRDMGAGAPLRGGALAPDFCVVVPKSGVSASPMPSGSRVEPGMTIWWASAQLRAAPVPPDKTPGLHHAGQWTPPGVLSCWATAQSSEVAPPQTRGKERGAPQNSVPSVSLWFIRFMHRGLRSAGERVRGKPATNPFHAPQSPRSRRMTPGQTFSGEPFASLKSFRHDHVNDRCADRIGRETGSLFHVKQRGKPCRTTEPT